VPPPRSLPQLFDAWEEEEQLPLPFYAAQLGIERFDGRLLQNIVNFLGDEEEVGWTSCSRQPCSRAERVEGRAGRLGHGGTHAAPFNWTLPLKSDSMGPAFLLAGSGSDEAEGLGGAWGIDESPTPSCERGWDLQQRLS
jgi:hypothetical protein